MFYDKFNYAISAITPFISVTIQIFVVECSVQFSFFFVTVRLTVQFIMEKFLNKKYKFARADEHYDAYLEAIGAFNAS